LLDEANQITDNFPLVLHGGTGLPETMVKQAISSGVVKVNISTALKMETHRALKDYLSRTNSYDELKFAEACMTQCAAFCDSFIVKYSL
jgi:fructose-bisphosphate aldolase class II